MSRPPSSPLTLRPARGPSVKGLVFREFVRWYETSHGRAATLRAIGSLPAELRAHLDPDREQFGILAGSWYPVELVTKLLETITSGLAADERSDLLRAGVSSSVRVTLTGVYKVLFKTLVTPERHAKYVQKIWDNYFNTGTIVGRMLGEDRSEQRITNWAGHHPLLCEIYASALVVFHEHMGCTDVKVSRPSCVLKSSDCCHFVIQWKGR